MCVSRKDVRLYVMKIASLVDVTLFVVVTIVLYQPSSAVEDVSNPGISTPQNKIPIWEPALTPWWNLTFGEGETLVVDCGVFTGGDPLNAGISWLGPNGKPLKVIHPDR